MNIYNLHHSVLSCFCISIQDNLDEFHSLSNEKEFQIMIILKHPAVTIKTSVISHVKNKCCVSWEEKLTHCPIK